MMRERKTEKRRRGKNTERGREAVKGKNTEIEMRATVKNTDPEKAVREKNIGIETAAAEAAAAKKNIGSGAMARNIAKGARAENIGKVEVEKVEEVGKIGSSNKSNDCMR